MPDLEPPPDESQFLDFISEHFDAAYYLQTYGDVAATGLDPLEHWLDCGLNEGRQISRFVVLRQGKLARRSSSRIWRHYRWRSADVAALVIKPISPNVVAQIINQARHDPAVAAAGAEAIAQLRQQDRENVQLDVTGLQRAIPHGVEFLVIAPNLGVKGDQSFTIDLISALSDIGFRTIHTIVADQESPGSLDQSSIPVPFQATHVLFWQDFWIHGPEAVRLGQLAQLINVLRPRATIIANSSEGHEMIARYGRALSERTKIYCLYIKRADDDDFAANFSHRILPFATVLTDDDTLAAGLRQQHADLSPDEVVVLPRHSPVAFHEALAALFGQR
jgi:hypothetical protein